PPDRDLIREEDGSGLVHAAHRAGVRALRLGCAGLQVPGTARTDAEPLLAELRMKVLVAGGTGYVGRAIVHALRARELDVRVLARGTDEDASHFASLGVELQRGDLTRPETLG